MNCAIPEEFQVFALGTQLKSYCSLSINVLTITRKGSIIKNLNKRTAEKITFSMLTSNYDWL